MLCLLFGALPLAGCASRDPQNPNGDPTEAPGPQAALERQKDDKAPRKQSGGPVTGPLELSAPNAARFSPDNKYVLIFRGVTGGTAKQAKQHAATKSVILYEVETAREVRRFLAEKTRGAVFMPKGNLLLSLTPNGNLTLWDFLAEKLALSFEDAEEAQIALSISADGQSALSISATAQLTLWNVSTGKKIRQFGPGPGRSAYLGSVRPPLALSPDGSLALSAAWGQGPDSIYRVSTGLWNVRTGKLIQTCGAGGVWVFSPDSKSFVHGSSEDETDEEWTYRVILREAATGNEIRKFEGVIGKRKNAVSVAAEVLSFSPDGTKVIAGCHDGVLRIWDVDPGNRLTSVSLRRGRSPVDTLAISPDTTLLLARDGCLWNINKAELIREFPIPNPKLS